jgi:hypothetical protein
MSGFGQVLIARAAQQMARTLTADIFLGPSDRVESLPPEGLIFACNHRWQLDGLAAFLASISLQRTFKIVASPRASRQLGFAGRQLGMVGLSTTPIANIRVIKETIEQTPKLALWIFPQGESVPDSWGAGSVISAAAGQTLKMLNREASVVPVHIELVVVRQLRASIVMTLGAVSLRANSSTLDVTSIFADLRQETLNRLASHSAEYRSLIRKDGLLFCGYPIRGRWVRQFFRAKGVADEAQLIRISDGWRFEADNKHPVAEAKVRAALREEFPNELLNHFLVHTEIKVD